MSDHCLHIKRYIKDFINRINETKDINGDTILVKVDVKSLYHITNHEGIEAVKSELNLKSRLLQKLSSNSCS